MSKNDYKGFRPGVSTAICRKSSTLLEFVALEIAKEKTPPHLNSLELIELGAVYVDGERSMNPARAIKVGDEVRIHTTPRHFSCPPDLLSRIVAENVDSILVEKPAGLPVEPLVDNAKENLISFLEDMRGQRFFPVHRLEPESEGLLLIAKTQDAAIRLSRAFTAGRVRRVYVAYVESPVRIGKHTLADASIEILGCEERKAGTNLITERHTTWRLTGEPLHLSYRLELEFSKARPKEIRSYLASQGTPIIGDRHEGSRYELIDAATGKSAMAFLAISLSTHESD